MKYLILITIFLIGCEKIDSWRQLEPLDYICTDENMALVNRDTKSCTENTSFYSTYCYVSAMDRYCKKKAKN